MDAGEVGVFLLLHPGVKCLSEVQLIKFALASLTQWVMQFIGWPIFVYMLVQWVDICWGLMGTNKWTWLLLFCIIPFVVHLFSAIYSIAMYSFGSQSTSFCCFIRWVLPLSAHGWPHPPGPAHPAMYIQPCPPSYVHPTNLSTPWMGEVCVLMGGGGRSKERRNSQHPAILDTSMHSYTKWQFVQCRVSLA